MERNSWAGKVIVSFTAKSKEEVKEILRGVGPEIEKAGGKIVKYSEFYGEGTGSSKEPDNVATEA